MSQQAGKADVGDSQGQCLEGREKRRIRNNNEELSAGRCADAALNLAYKNSMAAAHAVKTEYTSVFTVIPVAETDCLRVVTSPPPPLRHPSETSLKAIKQNPKVSAFPG